MAEKVLIVADPITRIPSVLGTSKDYKFDTKVLRIWLDYLGVQNFEVCWSDDAETITAFNGPLIALGNITAGRLMKAGKKCAVLPHPDPTNPKTRDYEHMLEFLQVAAEVLESENWVKQSRLTVLK